MKRKLGLAVAAVVALGLALLAFWPQKASHAGYPLARRVAGPKLSPLWQMPPETLTKLIDDDSTRLEQAISKLDGALDQARKHESLLGKSNVAELPTKDRHIIRGIWWSVVEPLVFVDDLKHRYEAWWGVDYVEHPRLHARAFALSFTALCAQLAAGHELIQLVSSPAIQKLFDEAMPEYGLPKRTFTQLRGQLTQSRDLMLLPSGSHWYDRWIDKHLTPQGKLARLTRHWRAKALKQLEPGAVQRVAQNQVETLRGKAFHRWFPVQEHVATWLGDTRLAREGRRLINDQQLRALRSKLRPGDIIVERRNWYLSNVGLPGFWPHAALYVGSATELGERFDSEPSVSEKYGRFSEHLAQKHPKAWQALGQRDADGHEQTVVEAISEGVVATSIEHSCGADYVAVLRPRLDVLELAQAVDQSLAYFGRPYDFDFNFATDDAVVCSELVLRAYEPAPPQTRGLALPWVTIAGRRSVPPTEIVRAFAEHRGQDDAQLDFVYFLEGQEREKRAVVADAARLAQTVNRPKWDLLQP